MATHVQENLQKKNAEYASSFKEGHLALPPAKKYAVVTCMDARIDPAAGMLTFKNEDAHAVVEENLGSAGKSELANLDFQPFPDLEKGVEDDVKFLKASKAIPDSVTISGWVYEVETGRVRRVI
ncbi:carbonic anhydrase, partial [Lecanoromycetidae sp. Uapishka_2]